MTGLAFRSIRFARRGLYLALSFLLLCHSLSLAPSSATVEVLYAPEDVPLERIVKLYNHARRYIYVAVCGLTSPLATKALVDAKKRGVDVRVITDRNKVTEPKQHIALDALRLAGIPIRVNQHDALMHLKQVVIDDEVNASGSMNHTTSGNQYNDERLDIITDHVISVRAREKFLSMWKDESRFQLWRN